MSRRFRVLVVDDSVVVRKLVTDVIAADPSLEVAGTAPNGRIALAKIEQTSPDLIVLDVEMPDLDGLGTLRELRAAHADLPVVMFSTRTERGASVTLEALMLGANDYVTKPANVGSVTEAIERVRSELVPKVRALCGAEDPPPAPSPATRRPGAPRPKPAGVADAPRRVEAIVIGVSTGGPNALAEMLPQLPADLGAPVLVVQHMPPMFTRLLSERLDKACRLPVREASGPVTLRGPGVWIAPGDHHLVVDRAGPDVRLSTNQAPPENSCRPSADVLFRSAAATYGGGTLALVLTGMGHDGLRGSEAVVEAGGTVLAQDQASSVVWGMPGAVSRAGLAATVAPLGKLAGEVTRRVSARGAVPGTARTAS